MKVELEVRPLVVRVYQDHEENDGWWTADVDNLPGVASEGANAPAALEALAEALAVYLKDGGALPVGAECSSDIPSITVEYP